MGNSVKRTRLRPEAQPVAWGQLTAHQQQGLRKLILLMREAVDRLDDLGNTYHGLPWLSEDSFSQLAFIDGKRGTGKSTLMLTLAMLLHDSRNDHLFKREHAGDLVNITESFRDRVVILEPLDMEPMPKGTPILSAILARLNQAAQHSGVNDRRKRGLLDTDVRDQNDYQQFTHLQAKIARALDGNLEARKGGLDREQFGKEVINQEDDRLMLPKLLSQSLEKLSLALRDGRGAPGESEKRLFLVPIDDVDLNPSRCLELLILLRHYSVPQLFFLLMGQRDLVESIVKLRISREYSKVGKVGNAQASLTTVPETALRRELAEVAAANLQKQIPSVVALPAIELGDVFRFRPLVEVSNVQTEPTADQRQTLGDFLRQIPINDPTLGVKTLMDLLQWSRPGAGRLPEKASDFVRGQYPGLGALEVTPRRLVDLWRDLSEVLEFDAEPDRILEVFTKHWRRILDEDPHLDRESRETLSRDGIDAVEVFAGDLKNHPSRHFVIQDIPTFPNPEDPTFVFRPVLRMASPIAGSGIPRLRLRGTEVEILHPRTRCAYVLLHDLQRYLGSASPNSSGTAPVAGASPVSVSWIPNSAGVAWPLPPVQTFAAQTEFFLRAVKLDYESGDVDTLGLLEERQIENEALQRLLGNYIQYGSQLTAGKEIREQASQEDWPIVAIGIVGDILRAQTTDPTLFQHWLGQVALLLMPEACGVSGGTLKQASFPQIDEIDNAIQTLRDLLDRKRPELQELRQAQLDHIWNANTSLWRHLNERSTEESWIFLRAKQPPAETERQISDQLTQFSHDLARLEQRMKRESELTEWISLARQAVTARKEDRDLASGLLDNVLEIAESIVSEYADDDRFAATLRREFEQAAGLLEDANSRDVALKLREHAVRFAERQKEIDPTNEETARALSQSYDRLGRVYAQQESFEQAAETFGHALKIDERLAGDHPDNIHLQRDLSVSLTRVAKVQLERGFAEDARTNLERAYNEVTKLASKHDDNAQLKFEQSVALALLGDACLKADDRSTAREKYNHSLGLLQKLLERDDSNLEHHRALARMHIRIGNANPRVAPETYQQARRITDRLLNLAAENNTYQLDHAVCLWKTSTLKQTNVREKKALLNEAWKIFQRQRQKQTYFFDWAKEAEQEVRDSPLRGSEGMEENRPVGKKKTTARKKVVKKKTTQDPSTKKKATKKRSSKKKALKRKTTKKKAAKKSVKKRATKKRSTKKKAVKKKPVTKEPVKKKAANKRR